MTRIHFVGTSFAGGFHFPGNLLSPLRGIRLSPDPGQLSPDLRESWVPFATPIICLEVVRAYENELVWRSTYTGGRRIGLKGRLKVI